MNKKTGAITLAIAATTQTVATAYLEAPNADATTIKRAAVTAPATAPTLLKPPTTAGLICRLFHVGCDWRYSTGKITAASGGVIYPTLNTNR